MRSAVATACVRVSASSFVIALRTCVRTVSGEMKSVLPMASFELPSARSRSTSRSRCVRFSTLSRRRAAGDDAREDRVDVRAALRDELDRADDLRERRLLEDEPARAGVERLREERAVAVGGVEDDAGLRRVAARGAGDLDAGHARHAQVEERDHRLVLADRLERLLAVAILARDRDPAGRQHLGDGLHDGRMVVGDEAGDRPGLGHGDGSGHRNTFIVMDPETF